jgi:hypothetical protein
VQYTKKVHDAKSASRVTHTGSSSRTLGSPKRSARRPTRRPPAWCWVRRGTCRRSRGRAGRRCNDPTCTPRPSCCTSCWQGARRSRPTASSGCCSRTATRNRLAWTGSAVISTRVWWRSSTRHWPKIRRTGRPAPCTGVFRIMVFHADVTRRQRESARLRQDVARWVADGELERRFANIVLMSLDRLLARHA